MTYWVNGFTGTVEECQRSSETDVTGDISGGGGDIDPEVGGTLSGVVGYINSTTTTWVDLYIKNAEKERHFTFGDFPVRKGHLVSVIWAARDGQKSGKNVEVYNHTLQKSVRLNHFYELTKSEIVVPNDPPAYTEDEAKYLDRAWNFWLIASVLLGWLPGKLVAFTVAGHRSESVLDQAFRTWVPTLWILSVLIMVGGRVLGSANAYERVKEAKAEVEQKRKEAKEKLWAESNRLTAELDGLIRGYIEKVSKT